MPKGRTKRWKTSAVKDGIVTLTISSWKYFSDLVSQELAEFTTYIFRGHESDGWTLQPSLFRLFETSKPKNVTAARILHLENFKTAVRGRRGSNPPEMKTENEWWALGQHNGLATPLLDWTDSPFVALYFAFEEERIGSDDHRVVYCLSEADVRRKVWELETEYNKKKTEYDKIYAELNPPYQLLGSLMPKKPDVKLPPLPQEPDLLEIVRPMTDENVRLVSQRGLFVRIPDNLTLENWIEKHFEGEDNSYFLIKVKIPNRGRESCIRMLNRMNINHLSLFPDLFGAGKYCNLDLQIKNY